MAKSVIVQVTDDFDGTPADESLTFALDGKAYEIDLSKKNADALRKAFAPYVEKARPAGQPAISRRRQPAANDAAPTMFSQLDAEEKERFRVWADMPTARRVGDARVQAWIDAGRP